jgi:hypothetical protein
LSPSIRKNSMLGICSRILETVSRLCDIIEQKAQLVE